MANPNIVNVTSIYGKVAGAVAGTSAANIVANSAGSNKIYKINTVTVSNINTTTAYSITIDLYKSGTTSYKIANEVAVPVGGSVIAISKDSSVYLEEGDSLRALASGASALNVVVSWEEIS